MKRYSFRTQGVCAPEISFDLDGDKVFNVKFYGGCNGNLKAISKLIDGMSVDEIEGVLRGNTCGVRDTSCSDQLAIAVRTALNQGE